eukprot:11555971-Alexandrium_andersonii.AAC.1
MDQDGDVANCGHPCGRREPLALARTLGGIAVWAEKLDEAFPSDNICTYLTLRDMTRRSKALRLWQLGNHPDTGSS